MGESSVKNFNEANKFRIRFRCELFEFWTFVHVGNEFFKVCIGHKVQAA